MELHDGRVIVTGGASGLGAAVVEALTKEGARPVVLDMKQSPSGVPNRIVDLADTAAAEAVVREVVEAERDGLAAVVACAGTDASGPLSDVPRDDWERVVKVNLLGTAAVVRAALPSLEVSHGTVVMVGSTLGLRALPAATAYCASKFGIVGFTRALQAEMQGRIGVTLLIPGGMATSFFDTREEQYRPAPGQMLNRPEDVARAVIFALQQPPGCEVRELLITPSEEPSWP